MSFSDNVSEREFAKNCKSETVEVAGEVELRCPIRSERSEGIANRKKNKSNDLETDGHLDWISSERTRFSTNSYHSTYLYLFSTNWFRSSIYEIFHILYNFTFIPHGLIRTHK